MQRTSHLISTALVTGVTCLMSVPASAAVPLQVCGQYGLCGVVHAIDDAQMASVAGKFTIAGEVVGMNLRLSSSWHGAHGQHLEAAASVSIALPGSGHAHARFDAQASASDPQNGPDASANAVASVHQGSGTQHVRGVGQVIQIAGDGNGAANRTAIHVTHDNVVTNGGNGNLNASYAAANGATASVNIANNGVSLELMMPSAGSARQQINLAGMGNIHQNIQIAADRQHVVNQMQLQLQMRPATAAALASRGVSGSLNMLRGR